MSAAAAACFSGAEIETQFDARLAPFLSISNTELIRFETRAVTSERKFI